MCVRVCPCGCGCARRTSACALGPFVRVAFRVTHTHTHTHTHKPTSKQTRARTLSLDGHNTARYARACMFVLQVCVCVYVCVCVCVCVTSQEFAEYDREGNIVNVSRTPVLCDDPLGDLEGEEEDMDFGAQVRDAHTHTHTHTYTHTHRLTHPKTNRRVRSDLMCVCGKIGSHVGMLTLACVCVSIVCAGIFVGCFGSCRCSAQHHRS